MNFTELQNHQKELYSSIKSRRNNTNYVNRHKFYGENTRLTTSQNQVTAMKSLSWSYSKLIEVLHYPDLATFEEKLYKINLSDIADDKKETERYKPCLVKSEIDIACLLTEKANILIDISKMFKQSSANQLINVYDHHNDIDTFQTLSNKYNPSIFKKYLDIKIMLLIFKMCFSELLSNNLSTNTYDRLKNYIDSQKNNVSKYKEDSDIRCMYAILILVKQIFDEKLSLKNNNHSYVNSFTSQNDKYTQLSKKYGLCISKYQNELYIAIHKQFLEK